LKKQDLYLILILLAAAAAVFFGYRLLNQGNADEVVVYVGEEEYARLPLHEDEELLITGAGDGTNRLVIKDGQADVTEASCPDKICVHQHAISEIGETIVCMPNQVIVTIEKERQE